LTSALPKDRKRLFWAMDALRPFDGD